MYHFFYVRFFSVFISTARGHYLPPHTTLQISGNVFYTHIFYDFCICKYVRLFCLGIALICLFLPGTLFLLIVFLGHFLVSLNVINRHPNTFYVIILHHISAASNCECSKIQFCADIACHINFFYTFCPIVYELMTVVVGCFEG